MQNLPQGVLLIEQKFVDQLRVVFDEFNEFYQRHRHEEPEIGTLEKYLAGVLRWCETRADTLGAHEAADEMMNGGPPKWFGAVMLVSMQDWLKSAVNVKGGAKVTGGRNMPFEFYTELDVEIQGRLFSVLMRPRFDPEQEQQPIK